MDGTQRTVLITAGPTREFFDPVRFISNPSSGKMGYAIARAAFERGWRVLLVSGPVCLAPPGGCRFFPVITGEEMLKTCEKLFPQCDLLIKAAAVCDFRPKEFLSEKFKKTGQGMSVEFEPVPDILKTLAAKKRAGQIVAGFAAETENVEAYALKKLKEKNLDFIVANRVGAQDSGFEADTNAAIVLGADGSRAEFALAQKAQLGAQLFDYLSSHHGQ